MTDHFLHLQRGNRVTTPSRNQPVVSTCVQDSDGRAWSVSVEKRCMVRFFFERGADFFCQHGHTMLIYCYIQHRCNADGQAVYCPSELQGQLTMTSFLRTSLPR